MSRNSQLALFLVVLGALLLRCVVAATSSIYVDEGFTYFISRSDFAGMLMGSRNDLNPPAWYFLLHPLATATRSVFWLRFPALLCGTLAVGLCGLVARRLCRPPVALSATLLLAVSYGCWLVDTQIRAYGITLLLVTAALWLFVETVSGDGPPGGWIPYGALCLCLPVFHYLGMLAAVALLGASAVAPLAVRRRLLAVHAMALLPGLSWILFIASGSESRFHPHHPDVAAVMHAFYLPEYLTGCLLPWAWHGVPDPLWWSNASWRILLNLVLWAALAWGARRVWAVQRPAAVALVLLVTVPLLLLSLGANLGVQSYQNRYTVPMAPAFYILLASGLSAVRLSAVTWALVGINLWTACLFPSRPFLWNQNWIGPASFVETREQSGDHVAAYIDYSLMGFDYYYRNGAVTAQFALDGGIRFTPGDQILLTPTGLDPALDASLGPGRVFLVLNQEDDVGGRAVHGWFQQRYHVLDSYHQVSLHPWGDIWVYLLERK